MEDYRQIIQSAEPGQIVPIVKRIDMGDPLEFFAKLSALGAHRERFAFCESVEFGAEAITGRIMRRKETVDEQTRLRATNQMDVLRAGAFAFRLAHKPLR